MKPCVSPDRLELFVLSESHSVADFQDVSDHLAVCSDCQFIVDELRTLYGCIHNVDKAVVKKMTTDVFKTTANLPLVREIVLKPVIYQQSKDRPYHLAAQGSTEPRHVLIQSYVDQQNEVVGRVMHDRVSETISLYLISDLLSNKIPQIVIENAGVTITGDRSGKTILENVQIDDLKTSYIKIKINT